MQGWDLDIFWHINRDWTSSTLDYLMPVLSAIDAWLPLLGLLLIIAIWRGGTQVRWMLLSLALAITVSDAIVGKTLKKAIGRVRPCDAMSGVMTRNIAKKKPAVLALVYPTTGKLSHVTKPASRGNSLPSNHTSNLFAAATVIALSFRRWGLPMYLLASAVAYSRIYVGAHWPSDVIFSLAIGLLIGLAAEWSVQKAKQRFAHPPPPGPHSV